VKINTKQLFENILKKGKAYRSQHLLLKTLEIKNIKKSQFYFVVSGKIIKKAIKRNLFKRQGRHITRCVKTKNCCIAVFFAKKGAGDLKFAELKEEAFDLMKKAKLFEK